MNGNINTGGAGGVALDGSADVDLGAGITIDTSLGNGLIDLSGGAVDGNQALVLNAGAGAVNLDATGQITPLASLDVNSSGTVSLNGDITTQGAAGVALDGSSDVDLIANITIDTTTNNGTINLAGGAVDGNQTLVLTAGAGAVSLDATGQNTPLSSLDVDTTGTADLAGNIYTTGIIDFSGTSAVTLSAVVVATSSAGNIDFTGGDINGSWDLTLDGGDVDVNSIGNSTALDSLTINASGTLTTYGANFQTEGGDIDLSACPDVELNATLTIDTEDGDNGIAGAVIFATTAAIDSATATARDLVITTNGTTNGDITLGIIGATQALSTLDFDGADIYLNGIGNGSAGAAILFADASSTVYLDGGADYWTTGDQFYNQAATGNTLIRNLTANSDFNANSNLFWFRDLYIDFPVGVTVMLFSDIRCQNFVFYGGTLAFNGSRTIRTNNLGDGDFVVFGLGFDDHDIDRTTVAPLNTDFAYPANGNATLNHDPGAGYDATFVDMTDATIDVNNGGGDQNFYVNGADMTTVGVGTWTLEVDDNSGSNPYTDAPWGLPFNLFFNAEVQNCATVTGGMIAAAEPATIDGNDDGDLVDAEDFTVQNNGVINGLGNDTEWDFIAPFIEHGGAGSEVATRTDEIVYIRFNESLKNFGTLDTRSATGFFGSGFTAISDAFVDEAASNNTDGEGDQQGFFLLSSVTWNSDADGGGFTGSVGAGDTAGGVRSTDYGGNNRNILSDITFSKGTFCDSARNRSVSYNPADRAAHNRYTGTLDQAHPTVVAIYADRDNGSGDNRDYHNYFRMLYSEPVNIGDLTIGAVADVNIKSNATFADATEHGGDIVDLGAVNVVGYFSYPGDLTTVSRTADTQVTAIRRTGVGQSQEVYFYVAGYDDGGPYTWPGVILGGTTDPIGQTATPSANTFVTDDEGNILDVTVGPPLPIADDPAGGLDTWDITQPGIAPFNPGGTLIAPYQFYEIVTKDDAPVNTITDRIEFHILDDYTLEEGTWDSDDHDVPVTGLVTPAYQGIRDVSVDNAAVLAAMGLSSNPGGGIGNLPTPTFDTLTTDSGVASLFKVSHPAANDVFFSVTFAEDFGFSDLDQLYFTYNPSSGDEYCTDLAGNVLISVTDIKCLERTPPYILYSLAVVGDDKIYVRFSEPVWQDSLADTPIDNTDFTVNGFTVNTVDILSTEIGGAKDAWLNLDSGLSENDVINQYIQMDVQDQVVNNSDITVEKSISDIGLGLMSPVWATDGLHQDSSYGGGFSTLRDFDGSGKLMDRDITLQASILAPVATGDTTSLIFDVNPPDSVLVNGFWLPFLIPEFNPAPNLSVRSLAEASASGALRVFLIPSGDSEIKNGNDLEFIFKLGNLYCARSIDPEDPRKIAPWILPIRDLSRQTGGVTILNNVINPGDGEQTVLSYELAESGMVTITVFGLDGDVVDVIQRGIQAKGEHTVTWSGTNRSGRTVARGIYFIRVVGPNIDEYRKVIVVK